MRRVFYLVISAYVICALFGFFGEPGYVGAVGRAPFAFLGEKTSISYMYDSVSYENYNEHCKSFWLKRGAAAGVTKLQRLYGAKLLNSNASEGINLLIKAADGGDFYAALILANIYRDPHSGFKNPNKERKYMDLANSLDPDSVDRVKINSK
jgi:hypothetical protein